MSDCRKPAKPFPDFPLFAHAGGTWAKKIGGRHVHFGPWDDWRGAEVAYRKYVRTGEIERGADGGITVADLANRYLQALADKHAAGEFGAVTFGDYDAVVRAFVAAVGGHHHVADLRPPQVAAYRKRLAARLAPSTLTRHVAVLRAMFRWAGPDGEELIDRLPRGFSRTMHRPPVKAMRRHRREAEKKHGKKLFTAADVRTILTHAPPVVRAWVLLGLNCGFGNTDVSRLEESDIDWQRGAIDTVRRKNEVRRLAPLWPETAAALAEARAQRPAAAAKSDAGRVFLSADGRPLVRETVAADADGIKGVEKADDVGEVFWRFLRKIGLKKRGERVGHNFYSLRRTFRTLADPAKDDRACAVVMAHSVGDIAELYIWDTARERLEAVVGHVWRRLFEGWSEPWPKPHQSDPAPPASASRGGGAA